jgi:cytochrome P450
MTTESMRSFHEYEYPSEEVVTCPYPFYASLRGGAPVHRLPNGDYLVSRWADLVHVARHPELFSNAIAHANPGFDDANAARAGEGKFTNMALPFCDPPDHTAKRSLLMPLFMPDALRGYQPTIRTIADDLIDAFPSGGKVDFRAAFADYLPPTVMLRLFGIPQEDEPMVRAWMQTSTGQGLRFATDEQKARQVAAMAEARAYFERALNDRIDHPTGDFLSEIVRLKMERDGQLDDYYLVGEVTTIYSAAYHNTVYMLCSAMRLLLQNPDQMARVREDRSLCRGLVDEALRLESPVQWLQRVVTEDTELGGVPLPKGAVCLVLWGSGNRDEGKFEDPDRFWIERPNALRDHLAFGYGIHKCLGARLARLEGQIAFEQLLDRLGEIRLDGEVEHAYDVNHRAPLAVPITYEMVAPRSARTAAT